MNEKLFYDAPQDAFAIYQVSTTLACDVFMRFMSLEYNRSKGYPIKKHAYDFVYAEHINNNDVSEINFLENLYPRFNESLPAEYLGHSLSVSDIIAIKKNGVIKYFYLDCIGYKEILDFV